MAGKLKCAKCGYALVIQKTVKTRIARLNQDIEIATQKAMEASGALIKYLSDKVTSLDDERTQCTIKLNELQAAQATRKCGVAQISNYLSKWAELTLEDKMIVVDALIDKIRLSEKEMSIKWNI